MNDIELKEVKTKEFKNKNNNKTKNSSFKEYSKLDLNQSSISDDMNTIQNNSSYLTLSKIKKDIIENSLNEITNENNNDNSSNINYHNTDFIDLSDSIDTESNVNIEKESNKIIRDDFVLNRKSNSKYYCKIGNTYAFWFDKNGEPRMVIGPHCKLIINYI